MKKTLLSAACLSAAMTLAAGESNDSVRSHLLKQVEITANRADDKTPVAFTNVTKQQLLKANDGRDITYLLAGTPSLLSSSDAGAGIGYSKMSIRGTDATRINVTANGVPLNDGESSAVYWVNMPDLASSLRDVQVQRGVGTSTNGAGAFGASVNMVTDAPSEVGYAELSGSYGSYNTNRQTLRVGSGLLGSHWSFDARLSHMGSDGYIDRASSRLWSYFGQAAYNSNRGTTVRLLAFGGNERTYMAWDYASKEDMAKYGRRYNPCGEYTDDEGNRAYYPDQYDRFTQHHFQALLSQRLNDRLQFNVTLHYTDDYGYYEQYKTNRKLVEYGLEPYVNAEGDLVKRSDLVRLKYNDNGFGGGLFTLRYSHGRWNGELGGAINYFHGRHFGRVQWVRNFVGSINPLEEYYRNTGKKLDGNVYVRANYEISRLFSAFADLQYRGIHYTIDGLTDNWDDATNSPAAIDVNRTWHFFNPKVGINFESGSHRAFASWSVAHKEPVRDNFTDGDPRHRPESERLFDYEAGYTFSHRIFSVGVNLYYMDYKDQLVLTGQISDTGNPLSVNVPSSYRMGIELQGALKPCKWFSWDINATLSRNRIKNFVEYLYDDEGNSMTIDRGDTPISFSPDFMLNNAFNFTVKGFGATIQSQYVGRQHLDNTGSDETVIDRYFVTNLHLSYQLPQVKGIKKWSAGLSVYNIFNNKYFTNGYSGAGYYMADGKPEIYHYSGYAAAATCHVAGTLSFLF